MTDKYDRYQADYIHVCNLNKEYGAEIRRLRAALEQIANIDTRMAPITNVSRMIDMAREALK